VPVLAGLLLETGPRGLVLSSFDYEVSARVEARAEVADEGKALVSGRLLADISRSLPDQPVDVATDGSKVVLTCGSARFSLATLPVDEYPTLPQLPPIAGTVQGELFATAVAQTAVAAGRDDTLPLLTGVRMEIDNDKVTLAATDRYRLAVRELMWHPEQPGLSAVALVPARTLAETAKALAAEGDVTIALGSGGVGDGLIGFEAEGRRTTTRLLDGEFVKYRSLLPTETNSVATVERNAFIEAVKRVALVAERNTPVRLAFNEGEVVLEAGSGDDAQASEALPANLDGEDIAIAFNPTFLLDGLNALETQSARLHFTTTTKPAVLTGAASEPDDKDETDGAAGDVRDTEYRYLIMPVRLSG
jgi:DNA polymerase-3 subunit beta